MPVDDDPLVSEPIGIGLPVMSPMFEEEKKEEEGEPSISDMIVSAPDSEAQP